MQHRDLDLPLQVGQTFTLPLTTLSGANSGNCLQTKSVTPSLLAEPLQPTSLCPRCPAPYLCNSGCSLLSPYSAHSAQMLPKQCVGRNCSWRNQRGNLLLSLLKLASFLVFVAVSPFSEGGESLVSLESLQREKIS